MAISTKFKEIQDRFNKHYWASIDEFELFFLRSIAERLRDTNYYTDRNGIESAIPPINHYPELVEYEVWIEGFSATGQSEPAHLMGKAMARNFAQACHIVMCKAHLKFMEEENLPNYTEYSTSGSWDYSPQELSFWGCRLFWSEELARKSFG
jgi:hypothetical protein